MADDRERGVNGGHRRGWIVRMFDLWCETQVRRVEHRLDVGEERIGLARRSARSPSDCPGAARWFVTAAGVGHGVQVGTRPTGDVDAWEAKL